MSSYLNELYRFHERMVAEPDSGMSPEGMTSEKISFALVIAEDGRLLRVEDLRSSKGTPQRLFVPAAVKRSVNVKSNFLWDNTGYVLGVDGKGDGERAAKLHASFCDLHRQLLAESESRSARAFLAFLATWEPEQFASLGLREALLGSNVIFRLDGEKRFLHEDPGLREIWLKELNGSEERLAGNGGKEQSKGICLVTGALQPIALIHPAIKGVQGAQSSGAALVSFNQPAFTSYGKEQNANAPVSEAAARGYTSALNYLLQREHGQMIQLRGFTMVVWAEKKHPAEMMFSRFLDLAPSGDGVSAQDTEQVERVKGILLALRNGNPLNEADALLDEGARFYLLGLAPNASRLAVSFWLTASLEILLRRVSRWYEDLDIERKWESDPEFPPLWLLLRDLAVQGKVENVPSQLKSQLMRCLFNGDRFPENAFILTLQRIRADKEVGYGRAALIKAYLCRNYVDKEKRQMRTLNEDEQNIGYRLGRAFALLEKAQKDALGGEINNPLREAYIGAASSVPRQVFPRLLRLTQHHVAKVRKDKGVGPAIFFINTMSEILGGLTDFPAVLSLADQGRFMLGYYHQTNALYRKKDTTDAQANNEGTSNDSTD